MKTAIALAVGASAVSAHKGSLRSTFKATDSPTTPTQIHFGYAGSDKWTNDGLTVTWTTANATATSTCMYGTSSNQLSETATGLIRTYLSNTYGGSYHHHVTLSGLASGQTYYFSCGDSAGGFFPPLSATTAPGAGESPYPLKLITYGDMGIKNSENSTLRIQQQMGLAERSVYPQESFKLSSNTDPISFIWGQGDQSYADDSYLYDPFQFSYEWVQDAFANNMSNAGIWGAVPFMILPGNHEAECHSPICFLTEDLRNSLQNFSAYNARYDMPASASGGTMNMWYSFRYGRIHFCSINTETDFPNAPLDEYAGKNGGFGDQIAWVTADLAQAQADREAGEIDWIIVGSHRPSFSAANAGSSGIPSGDSADAILAAFQPIFLQNKVDVVIAGHEHSSEFGYPVMVNNATGTPTYNMTTSYNNPPWPVYMVLGGGGNVEGVTTYSTTDVPEWSRSRFSAWGIGLLYFENSTSLTIGMQLASTGLIGDEITITKS